MLLAWDASVLLLANEEIGKFIPNESLGRRGEPASTQHNFLPGIMLASRQQMAGGGRRAAPLLSERDSDAEGAAHGRRDAGLHGSGTNSSQLSPARGQIKSCKIGLRTHAFHAAEERVNNASLRRRPAEGSAPQRRPSSQGSKLQFNPAGGLKWRVRLRRYLQKREADLLPSPRSAPPPIK